MDDLAVNSSDWVGRVLAQPGQPHRIEVAGNSIHYLEWPGPAGAPGLLLVHGFRAHAHWWDFIAPMLAENYRVIAMDMGGMGDSGHRESYSHHSHSEEIAGVLEHTQLRDAVLVGHSFGGLMSIGVFYHFPHLLKRGIVVDSRVSFPDDDVRDYPVPLREKRRFTDPQSALQRYRLVPDQGGVAAVIFDHVARHSLTQENGSWMWKFDSACIAPSAPLPELTDGEMLAQAKIPVDFICGEHSAIIPPELGQRIGLALPCQGRGPIVIPDAHHHVLLDQPLALVAALRSLLA